MSAADGDELERAVVATHRSTDDENSFQPLSSDQQDRVSNAAAAAAHQEQTPSAPDHADADAVATPPDAQQQTATEHGDESSRQNTAHTDAQAAAQGVVEPAADAPNAAELAGAVPREGLSKNQQKKLAKLQRRKEKQQQKKAAEKAKKAEQQAAKQEAQKSRWESMTPEEQEAHKAERAARLSERRQQDADKKQRLHRALETGQKLVIDLDFEGLMAQPEINSLAHQLMHSYAANSRASTPCHLHFTSLKGAIAEAVERQVPGYQNWHATFSEQSYHELLSDDKEHLVYLTADSPDEIKELDSADIYIIGGIVDRNRHKGLCFQRATDQGIRTARLPIGSLMQLTTSSVLTTNQVVEILLRYLASQDWKSAFETVVPLRKRSAEEGDNDARQQSAKRAKQS